MEYQIHQGIITKTKKPVKGLGQEDFILIIKEIINKLRIPYYDPDCPEADYVATLRFNEVTGQIEKLTDPENHIYTPLVQRFPYQVRYNPFQKQLEYWNEEDQEWVYFVKEEGASSGIDYDGTLIAF